jgi:antitoxin component YwqK of YwqJK toxin-antitoxin module
MKTDTIIEYYPTGEINSIREMLGDHEHGLQKFFFKNGIISCHNIKKMDLFHGIYQSFESDGRRYWIEQNRNGLEHGCEINFKYAN